MNKQILHTRVGGKCVDALRIIFRQKGILRLAALALSLVASLMVAAPAFAAPPTFQTHQDYALPGGATKPVDIVRADFNGDTYLDLVTANRGNCVTPATPCVTVFLNDTTGKFFTTAAQNFTSGAADPTSINWGDFNGDGKPDIVVTDRATNSVWVLLNQTTAGTLAFSAPNQTKLAPSVDPTDVAVRNFNGDGLDDLAITNQGTNDVDILISQGDGTFLPASGSPYPGGGNLSAADTALFNSDNIPDLVVANMSGNSAAVRLGLGGGVFGGPTTKLVDAGPSDVKADDFNGDGKQDLVTVNTGAKDISVVLGNGDGTFQPASSFAAGIIPGGMNSELAVDDYNRDGNRDVAVTSPGDSTVRVLTGNGNGTFNAPPEASFSVGTNPSGLTTGDFDKKNGPDLATSNLGSDNISVLLNSTPAPPTPPSPPPSPPSPSPSPSPPSPSPSPSPFPPNNPQYGNPQYGNPQYGNPQYGNPQYGNPQYGNGNTPTGTNPQTSTGTNPQTSTGTNPQTSSAGTSPGNGSTDTANGTNPDNQAPVSGPQGDVVPSVPTGGEPLPPTGGMPVWRLASLAGITLAPLIGIALVAPSRLAARWMRRRRGE